MDSAKRLESATCHGTKKRLVTVLVTGEQMFVGSRFKPIVGDFISIADDFVPNADILSQLLMILSKFWWFHLNCTGFPLKYCQVSPSYDIIVFVDNLIHCWWFITINIQIVGDRPHKWGIGRKKWENCWSTMGLNTALNLAKMSLFFPNAEKVIKFLASTRKKSRHFWASKFCIFDLGLNLV